MELAARLGPDYPVMFRGRLLSMSTFTLQSEVVMKFMLRCALGAACVLALLVGSEPRLARADEPLAEMLRRLPSTSNAIAVIDVKAMCNSAIGKKNHWRDRREVLTDGASYLPRNVDMIVMASTIDMADFTNSWTLAVVDMARDVTAAELVKNERGTKDQVSGRDVVWTPRNAYLIPLKSRLVAQWAPANRQNLANWLKLEKQSTVTKLTPFLDRATNEIGRASQAVVAFDLEDALLPALIKEHLKVSQAVPSNANLDALSRTLASIKGFKLAVTADEDVKGTLTIEFGESVESLAKFAKPLLLETLTAIGAEIEDLPKWDAVTAGNLVVLKGNMSPGFSSRILSLFDLPTGIDEPGDAGTSPGAAATDPKTGARSAVAASKRYYQSIRTILDDLKAQKATSQKGLGTWYGRYARKIDQLPVLDVDPDLLSFSQQLSEALRRVASSYNGVSAASAYRKTLGGSYNYYGGASTTAADAARIRKQEDIYALKVYHDTWDDIENRFSALRKSLTTKYGVEF